MSVSSRIDNWKCRWKNFWQTNFYVAHFQRRTQSLSKIVTNHHSSTVFEIQPKKSHFYFKNQFESSRQKSIIQAQFLSFFGRKNSNIFENLNETLLKVFKPCVDPNSRLLKKWTIWDYYSTLIRKSKWDEMTIRKWVFFATSVLLT